MQSEANVLKRKGYTVGNKLGSGSYATVKSAQWIKPGGTSTKQVALKIINQVGIPKDFKEKFLPRELDVVRLLDHANVIKTWEIFSGGKKTFMALEYAAHGDLLDFVRARGALEEGMCAKIFSQIASGLNYLHTQHIVHRDLKCENILLNKDNVAKLADFGFARKIGMLELSKTYCGSMAYAAPEILKGIPYVGYSADIWSLGVILFVMLSAMMPYRNESISRLTLDQRSPPKYPKNAIISRRGKLLVEKLLNYENAKRPKSQEVLKHEWLKPYVNK